MRKKVIIGLTSATILVGSYAVFNQYVFNDEEKLSETINVAEKPVEINEPSKEVVIKEVKYLSAVELESLEITRDPFKAPPIVVEQYERKEKEYNDLKAKIEKRIAELEEAQGRKEAEEQGVEYKKKEKSFEEILEEEIEKIINEASKEKRQTVSTGKMTNDKSVVTIVEEQAKKYKVDKNIILAIIGSKTSEDGNFEVRDENGTYNRGLMQINTATSKWLAKLMGIDYVDGMEFDNEKNVMMGAYYLSQLQKEHDDIHYIITAYYIGPNGAERIYEKAGDYESDYSRIILNRMK